MILMTRRPLGPVHALRELLLALALLTSSAASAAPQAPDAPQSADVKSLGVGPLGVRTLGSPTAPITVVEYASVGCPHCATWANTVFPEFKKRFVDTGKVQFVFHEMLTGDLDLAVAGFLLADCAPPEKYFDVVDAIFADQSGILRVGGPALFKIARDAGMTQVQFEACLTDEAALKSLQERTDRDASDHGVTATPTFIVGDQKLGGDIGLEALGAAIDRARPKG